MKKKIGKQQRFQIACDLLKAGGQAKHISLKLGVSEKKIGKWEKSLLEKTEDSKSEGRVILETQRELLSAIKATMSDQERMTGEGNNILDSIEKLCEQQFNLFNMNFIVLKEK